MFIKSYRLIVLLLSLLVGGIGTVASQPLPLDIRYIHVDLEDPAWPGLRTQLEARHEQVRPGNIMSVVVNNFNDEAYVKVIGMTSSFMGLLSSPAVLQVEADNQWILEMIRSDPAWKRELN